MLTVILMYLGVGAIAGVLAGLLGVGGGLVIVPMMVITLTWQGIPPEHIMHLALGTSLASIIFTSVVQLHGPSPPGRGAVAGGAPHRLWASFWAPSWAPPWPPGSPPVS